ncbi:hypothetical protein D3C87_1634890 [compost metagenome]
MHSDSRTKRTTIQHDFLCRILLFGFSKNIISHLQQLILRANNADAFAIPRIVDHPNIPPEFPRQLTCGFAPAVHRAAIAMEIENQAFRVGSLENQTVNLGISRLYEFFYEVALDVELKVFRQSIRKEDHSLLSEIQQDNQTCVANHCYSERFLQNILELHRNSSKV